MTMPTRDWMLAWADKNTPEDHRDIENMLAAWDREQAKDAEAEKWWGIILNNLHYEMHDLWLIKPSGPEVSPRIIATMRQFLSELCQSQPQAASTMTAEELARIAANACNTHEDDAVDNIAPETEAAIADALRPHIRPAALPVVRARIESRYGRSYQWVYQCRVSQWFGDAATARGQLEQILRGLATVEWEDSA